MEKKAAISKKMDFPFNKIKFGLSLIAVLGLSQMLHAQDTAKVDNPPVNFEIMPATEGIVGQLMINKKFKSLPRFGFFSVNNVISDWDRQKPNDFMHQAALTFELIDGLDMVSGYHYTDATGFRGSAALMYTIKKKDWLTVLAPRIDLSNDANYEIFGFVEYTPKISPIFDLYTRLQGLYVMSVKESKQQRSYIWLRAGLTYKEFSFGLGANIDFFGPEKTNINNFGIFLSADLF